MCFMCNAVILKMLFCVIQSTVLCVLVIQFYNHPKLYCCYYRSSLFLFYVMNNNFSISKQRALDLNISDQ